VTGKRIARIAETTKGRMDDYGMYYFKWTGEASQAGIDYGPSAEARVAESIRLGDLRARAVRPDRSGKTVVTCSTTNDFCPANRWTASPQREPGGSGYSHRGG